MSSATPRDPVAANRDARSIPQEGERAGPPGLSPRQQELNRLWSYFRSREYDGFKTAWDGTEALDDNEREQVVRAQFIPPGMYAAGSDKPLRYRKPVTPLGLIRTIVLRFTGLLFGHGRAPQIACPGDPKTEGMLVALSKQGRLSSVLYQARNYGGSMGSVALSFKFVNGKVVFEAHDPRWSTPEFADAERTELASLEKKYSYPVEEMDSEGEYQQVWYWHRRLIDREQDAVWLRARSQDDGSEPDWTDFKTNPPDKHVIHNLGECPAVWVQNQPVDEDIDGDPDCPAAVYALSEAIDQLFSGAHQGTIDNCDPTVSLSTDSDMASVAKGSDNAIKLEKGGSAHYMELNGSGAKSATELAEKLEDKAYKAAQCIPESDRAGAQPLTATEVERTRTSMREKTDVLRDQYGAKGILPLFEKLERVVRTLAQPQVLPNGQRAKVRFKLPPKPIHGDDGNVEGYEEHELGPGGALELIWGPYFPPTLADIELAGRAAGQVIRDKVLDAESAVRFACAYFGAHDPLVVLQRLKAAKEAEDAAAAAEAAPPDDPDAELPDDDDAAPDAPMVTRQDFETGVFTINEYRQSLGLGALPDGDLTWLQYKAKYATLVTAATAVVSDAAGTAFFAEASPTDDGNGAPQLPTGRRPPPLPANARAGAPEPPTLPAPATGQPGAQDGA